MCGIMGLWNRSLSPDDLEERGRRGRDALVHRGPDSAGQWLDPETGLYMGHRRLSIIDLSEAGSQPMISHDERYVTVYNGEIYNFMELRRELETRGVGDWRGHSDTEVLLEAFSAWGVADTLSKLDGMFAIALWDTRERTLTLARDRAGEKPLYWGMAEPGTFFFGSELKSLPAMGYSLSMDPEALALYFRFHYVPSPYSIFRGIRKLRPGTYVTVRYGDVSSGTMPEPAYYWDPVQQALAAHASPWEGSVEDYMDEAERLLEISVRRRMISDVPLGAFLSGGIDSTLVTAVMQKVSEHRVRTFSIGFREFEFDESVHAAEVARHLDTEHVRLVVSPHDTLNMVDRLPEIWDEPFADPSQIPTYLLSRLTREHVTVAMSGDAGDEVAGGYPRYIYGLILHLPAGSKIAHLLGVLLSRAGYKIAPVLSEPMKGRIHRFIRLGETIERSGDFTELYEILFGGWCSLPMVNIGDVSMPDPDASPLMEFGVLPFMQMHDFTHYLPDDIFVKVDRASMAVSLETRVPLVEPDFLMHMWSMPVSWRIRRFSNKWILRRLVERYVPRSIMDRPKHGFSVPIGSWLKDELREWAEDLLSEDSLARSGFIDVARVRKIWNEHRQGIADRKYLLWNVLMFQSWYDRWFPH